MATSFSLFDNPPPKLTTAQFKTFRACCETILQHVPTTKALNWCYGYAEAGLNLHSREAIKLQCDYILSNTTHWRGTTATRIRTNLKTLSKELA